MLLGSKDDIETVFKFISNNLKSVADSELEFEDSVYGMTGSFNQ